MGLFRNFINGVKKYMTVGIILSIAGLSITVILLGRCVSKYKAQVYELETRLQEKENYLNYYKSIIEKEKQIDEKKQKQINKINNYKSINDITNFLNKLYSNNLSLSPMGNSTAEKTKSAESGIQK